LIKRDKQFNKISQVNEGEVQANFSYGIDHQRVKQIITTNQEISQEKIYYGDDYEKIINDNGTKGIHYISSPKGICAAIEINQDNEISIKYILTDNLGSFQVVTDQNGNLLEELSFDSWGRRRNPSTWSREDVPTEFIFDRGFTGHEHMDVFRLINMNGRIYDPITGRYLSPDPLIQSPDFSQSLNRYSYCMNNPLTFKDPNGEFVWVAAIVAAVVGAVIDYGVQVAVNYACGKSDADAWFNDIDFFDILTTGVISGLTFGYGGAASAGNSIGKFGTYILNNKVAVGVTQTVLTSAIDITGNGVQPVSFSGHRKDA
jgi:RHS repeat-associated protein